MDQHTSTATRHTLHGVAEFVPAGPQHAATEHGVAMCYVRFRVQQRRPSMVEAKDKVTRFAADLVDAAAAEGARESRSARQQLDHWVRVGRAVSHGSSAARRRVEAALAGELPMTALSVEEGVAFNAEVTAAIEEHLVEAHYGRSLAAEGVTTVAIDDDGHLVEHHPDGSTNLLAAG